MIIIGYQGIGKSTLAQRYLRYIDLESSSFWVNGSRSENWYIEYAQMAEHLSNQGYIVFVSSHEVVRNVLKDSNEKVVCCVPAIELKDQWIEKLKNRYDNSGLEKDRKAYLNAKDRYEENINEIINSGFDNIIIKNIDYDLQEEINKYCYCRIALLDIKKKLLQRQNDLLIDERELLRKKIINIDTIRIGARIDEITYIMNLIGEVKNE